MLDAIRALFSSRTRQADTTSPAAPAGRPSGSGAAVDPLHLAACALLLDIAHADGEFSDEEQSHLEEVLARHFGISGAEGQELLRLADAERRNAIDHFQFTSVLKKNYDLGQKMVLAEVMWGLVLSDGNIAEHEHYLARKIANLLDLEPAYLSSAKQAAEGRRE